MSSENDKSNFYVGVPADQSVAVAPDSHPGRHPAGTHPHQVRISTIAVIFLRLSQDARLGLWFVDEDHSWGGPGAWWFGAVFR